MDNSLIVVLAIVIALSLGGGVYLLMSGVEEPPEPMQLDPGGPVGDPSIEGVPEPELPGPVAPPFPEPEPDAPPAPAAEVTKPAPPAVSEEAAIATMKATLEGTTFTLEAKSLEIRAALDLIAKLAGVEINTNLADSDALDRKISFKFDSVGILDGLEFICQMSGLTHEVGPRGIMIK